MDSLIYVLIAVIGSFLFVLFVVRIIRNILHSNTAKSFAYDKDILLIRVPKQSRDGSEKELTAQALQEDIAAAESIFSLVGGLKARPRGLMSWLFGDNNTFAFEIVANNNMISFYIVVPKRQRHFIEQEIYAHYPAASIEEKGDYNIFKPTSSSLATMLTLKRSNMFAIRTYKDMAIDPMDSIINTLAKLNDNEGAVIQIIVRSAPRSWRGRGLRIMREVRQGKTLTEAIHNGNANKFFNVLHGLTDVVLQTPKKEVEARPQMTPVEEESLKTIEHKMSKAGLEANIRIIVSAVNDGQAKVYLDNIKDAFSQYTIFEYGNGFQEVYRHKSKHIINDFIFRNFHEKAGMVLNTEEMASIFHLPLPNNEVANIEWLTAKLAPAPSNTPTSGLHLGENIYHGTTKQIYMNREDRRRHMYIIGKSGTGKSNLIAYMARQDIQNGEGVCVIDPHGDLIEDVLAGIPKERIDDVVYFAPADTSRPLGLNLLEYDVRYPEQKTFVINEMIKIFDKLYDLRSTGGPIFEQYIRNAMLLIMDDPDSGSTLMEIPRVLADANFRKMKLANCKDPTVVSFWQQEAEKAGGDAALANVVPYITSKLTSFVSNATMRPIIGQQKSAFNLRDIMDGQKILLLNLSKGKIGEMNSYLLGMVLVGKILAASLSRTDIPQAQRKDFYLYIDEFQNFTTDSISIILSEARKYNLNLIMAHQYLGQLVKNHDTSIRDAVFGNVGTWALFKIGSEDSDDIIKEFEPVFSEFDLINIEKYSAYVKLLISNATSRPFSMQIPKLEEMQVTYSQQIKDNSKLKYGREYSMVEAEIMKRMQHA